VAKLEEFIKSPGDDLKFDLDTAILMCRQGGYFDQAAYLARKHGEHELVVDILIEDSKRYAEALAYIWRLEPETAFYNLLKYATVLLEQCPKDTTQLFIDYYTGNFRPKKDAIVIPNSPSPSGMGGLSLGVASSAVQNLAALLPLPYMNTSAVATPPGGESKSTISQAQIVETNTDDPAAEYTIPKPRTAFSAFVDHAAEFIVFLEACIQSTNLREDDKVDLYTTLFEMYLHTASLQQNATSRSDWESKAKSLIQNTNSTTPIDTSNVLLLSHLSHFRDGTILVREQQNLHSDIFRSYTAANDVPGALHALHKYGPLDPSLYPAALAYFTSTPSILAAAGASSIAAILDKIDADNLMAPLQVIQTLSATGVANMGMIKRYLATTIERERAEIAQNRASIDTLASDTLAKRARLADLEAKPVVFQASRCKVCNLPLDPPTVHFLCSHSFHRRCIAASDTTGTTNNTRASSSIDAADVEQDDAIECPLCADQNQTVRAIRRAQVDSAQRHDLFKDAVSRGSAGGGGGGFVVVSEWFGRGVMME
jgi:vacuolar protein sorting-associated protein 11